MNQQKLEKEIKEFTEYFFQIYKRGNMSEKDLVKIKREMNLLKSLVDNI